MTKTFPILLAATLGCASEVDLPIDLDPGAEAPPETGPEPSDPPDQPEPRSPAPDSMWTQMEFAGQGEIRDLVWTTDGAVVAATPRPEGLEAPPDRAANSLTRYAPDGAIEWVAYPGPTDRFRELAAVEGGGVVVGIWPDATSSSRLPAALAWYDADGDQTASWRPPAEETGELLVSISSLRPLPDGSVFWAGSAGIYNAASVAGLLDAERQLRWIVPLPTPDEGYYQSGHPDVAPTADGGFAVLASYEPETLDWPGDEPEPRRRPKTYVFQLGPDGEERWRMELVGLEDGDGIRAASSGNLIVAASFDGSISVGDLALECGLDVCYMVAEIDPAGRTRGIHEVELPAWIGGVDRSIRIDAMTVAGDELVIASEFHDAPSGLAGMVATTHRLDGTLVSDAMLVLQVARPDGGGGTGPRGIDVAPDGRVAVGGVFSGSVDFGDGVVEGGVNENGFPRGVPFLTIFEPNGSDVD